MPELAREDERPVIMAEKLCCRHWLEFFLWLAHASTAAEIPGRIQRVWFVGEENNGKNGTHSGRQWTLQDRRE